jgi:hypothetical protein
VLFGGSSNSHARGLGAIRLLGVPTLTHLARMLGGWDRQGTQRAFGEWFSSHARRLDTAKLLGRFVEEPDLRDF